MLLELVRNAPEVVIGFLLAVNVIAFAAFGWDKRQAMRSAGRVPERTLVGLALVGGWFGAKAGQWAFRHKTVKEDFQNALNLVPVIWIGLAAIGWIATAVL
ncbi:MAG: DUF1294 domain-containing protein [Paracoccaceae bacterium]|nr:DUF1294 domain-containing protein [Paracoccaceae bacterium]